MVMIYNMYKFNTKDQNIFFTSDTHFGHNNILKYCNRPFSSIDEMDEALIKNWNNVVGENDIVFHLGDFGFYNSNICDIINRLHCKIYLILGNHDRRLYKKGIYDCFEGVYPEMYVTINDQKIYLNHKPYLCFDGTYCNDNSQYTWQLFGHVHSGPYNNTGLDNSRLAMLFPTQYDVGVDNNDFKPVSFSDVKNIIDKRLLESKNKNI